MAYPDKINALVDVTGDQTLAAGGHAARHNDVNDALDELEAVFTAPAANELALRPDGTNQRFHIDSAGDVTITGDISFDGGTDLTTALAGKAPLSSPTFTGTVEAADIEVSGGVFLGGTAAGNELEDYEEGTWTPTYTTTSTDFTSVTYDATTAGSYVKIGEMVYVTGWLRTDAITLGSASGDVVIGGLPYAPTNLAGNSNRPSVSIGYANAFVADVPMSGQVVENQSFVRLYYRSTADGASIALQVADLGTGSNDNDLLFSTFYRV